jgi:hypothetical protein
METMSTPPERAEPISLWYDIADGEEVEFAYDGERLTLQFVDWHERHLRLTFATLALSGRGRRILSWATSATTARILLLVGWVVAPPSPGRSF